MIEKVRSTLFFGGEKECLVLEVDQNQLAENGDRK